MPYTSHRETRHAQNRQPFLVPVLLVTPGGPLGLAFWLPLPSGAGNATHWGFKFGHANRMALLPCPLANVVRRWGERLVHW